MSKRNVFLADEIDKQKYTLKTAISDLQKIATELGRKSEHITAFSVCYVNRDLVEVLKWMEGVCGE